MEQQMLSMKFSSKHLLHLNKPNILYKSGPIKMKHVMPEKQLYIGMMSGTSLDAIDAVLVDFSTEIIAPLQIGLTTLARCSTRIDESLRHELLALHTPGFNELHRAQCASLALAQLYIDTIENLLHLAPENSRKAIKAVGIHGQTIRHHPEAGYTLQLNAPATIAEHTGLNIVSDFRSRDIAAGGQGAPLVPAFHAALLGCKNLDPDVFLNLGGISNISVLHTPSIRGWDCGPANMLLDAWCEKHLKCPYDEDGRWGASGKYLPDLLAAFLSDPYFSAPPPKSTGRDYFNLSWLNTYINNYAINVAPEHIQATLMCLTTESIVQDIVPLKPDTIFVGGGGAKNSALIRQINTSLNKNGYSKKMVLSSQLGLDPADIEALAFAWLAQQHFAGKTGNIPSVTGAKESRCLGSFTPGGYRASC